MAPPDQPAQFATRTDGLQPLQTDRLGRLPGWAADAIWLAFSTANFVAIAIFRTWETVPFHFVWVSMTLIYGFRVWSPRRTVALLGIVVATSSVLLTIDVVSGAQPIDELTEIPLMSAMFLAMVWHARRRLAAQLEAHRLAEHNLRLLEQNARLVQDASHELRTPIMVALGHAEVVRRDTEGTALTAASDVVVEELNRLRRLSDRLLALACSERPDFLLMRSVELEPLLIRLLHRWSPTPRCWRLNPLDEVTIAGDSDALTLALDALIDNAVKNTEPDDVIEVSLVDRGDLVEVCVADTGRGMPADEEDTVLTRGVTLAGADTVRRGTGLGLAIVKAVVERHGGTVSVASRVGEGTTIGLRLPKAAERGTGKAATSAEPAAAAAW